TLGWGCAATSARFAPQAAADCPYRFSPLLLAAEPSRFWYCRIASRSRHCSNDRGPSLGATHSRLIAPLSSEETDARRGYHGTPRFARKGKTQPPRLCPDDATRNTPGDWNPPRTTPVWPLPPAPWPRSRLARSTSAQVNSSADGRLDPGCFLAPFNTLRASANSRFRNNCASA